MSTSSQEPCAFFALGKCRHGAACRFSHAAREPLAPRPMACKFFLQGTCSAGRGCKFLHDPQLLRERRQVSATTRDATLRPGAFGVPCKFFKAGECSAGDRCPYVHAVKKASSGASRSSKEEQQLQQQEVDKLEQQTEEQEQQQQQEEEKPAEPAEPKSNPVNSASDRDVTELSEFLTKEEELYYYGAPGEFEEEEVSPSRNKPSYRDVASTNVPPQVFKEAMPAPPKICTFFLQGLCKYGNSCFYSHSLNERIETEDEMIAIGEEIRLSKELECGICYDNVMEKGERFGLLSGCNHAFCLTCVRNWRGHADQPKQTVRQCPVCRVETNFIIPSSRMVTNPERKKALINEYRKNLSAIPCRHFNEGKGTCPFGTSCFYAHKYPDGTLASREVRTAVDSEGQYDVLRQIRLEQYFERQTLAE